MDSTRHNMDLYIIKSDDIYTPQNLSGNQSTSDAPTSSRGFDGSQSFKCQRIESKKVDASFERDPGLRKPIWMYDINQQDEVRRAYIDMGPFQPKLESYKPTHDGNQNRRFQYSWFTRFPWIEYSIAKDKVFCFPCFLFDSNPSRFPMFTVNGFSSWKRVNCGDQCVFVHHEGKKESYSLHGANMMKWENLKDPSRHIDNVMKVRSSQQVLENRLRLQTSIEAIKWLAKQAVHFEVMMNQMPPLIVEISLK
ncbi:hypothetical protein Ddye_009387 [Dipteronia dyeriana]|uniref:TTF-type domain-containing protein n=1 Tax=Dipteronia dyeriana TaxID=168575 RepID=A0AAE0CM80_9ROSI|nr:hypothetical protein Ddye_009387 [Dipteronia dyeriana]